MRYVAVFCILPFAILPLRADDSVISIPDLVSAHRSAIQSIHSLQVHVEVSSTPSASDYIYTWTWDGDRQRCQHRFTKRNPHRSDISGAEFPMGITDAYNGPDGYKALLNYAEGQDTDLNEAIDHPAQGQIANTKSGNGLVIDTWSELALSIPLRPGFAVPLWEALDTASASQTLLSPDDTDSNGCHVIELTFDDEVHEVWLNPTAGFMIQAHFVRDKQRQQLWSRRVLEFSSLKDGSFFPAVLQTRIGAGPEYITIDATAKVLALNTALPDSAFDVHFPPGLRVFDQASGNRMLWGDGEPATVFSTVEEFRAWDTEVKQEFMAKHPSASRPQKSSRMLVVVLSSLGTIILFFMFRSKLQKN